MEKLVKKIEEEEKITRNKSLLEEHQQKTKGRTDEYDYREMRNTKVIESKKALNYMNKNKGLVGKFQEYE